MNFRILFDINTNYKVAEECANYMNKLIKQGRSFGINVLIASQGIARLHDISLDARAVCPDDGAYCVEMR